MKLVAASVKEGAEILIGGKQIGNRGYFYRPSILKNVTPKMHIAQEEIFGPVAPIIVAGDEVEAIKLANDSEYGLGLDKAEGLSAVVQSGIVSVNNVVISDPRVRFGGIKKSGFGRELSRYGTLEFANIKSIRFYDRLVDQHHVE
jgi:acyl-CoA reductase-like NAD-dependent aldehyde dehydrogenase